MASQDVPTMSSSSSSSMPTSHRLPTISAAQALHGLHARGSRAVSTGLAQLNRMLSPPALPGGLSLAGGLMRGKVTEVVGPPGVGKTAFGIQAAVEALREGQRVVWVDAACARLVPRRLYDVLFATTRDPRPHPQASTADLSSSSLLPPLPPDVAPHQLQSRFHHFTSPSLAHLLALFVHPPAAFPPPGTSLIVVDSLSILFDNAYPRTADDRTARNKSDQTRWAAGRKFAVMNELISTLARVAAMHDIALLITSQTITRIRGGSRALLVPAISGAEWENGVSTRLVLFRDWVPGQGKWTGAGADADADRLQKARFVGVVKANGVTLAEEGGVGNVVPFVVERTGLCDVNIAAVDIAAPAVRPPQARPPKRRFTEIDDDEDEHPDNNELYGWVEDDEVAAEGLLIDEAVIADHVNAAESRAELRTDRVPEQSKKVTQNATL